jgi:hypothetical protein
MPITDEQRRRITWDDLLRPGDAQRFFTRDPLPIFDPEVRTYSASNAWWLAELSRIVYRLGESESTSPLRPLRRELLAAAGFEEIGFIRSDATGTGVLIVRSRAPDFAVVVFRGTEQELQDYVHDADTLLVPAFGNTACVHRGFKRALNSVWTSIDQALTSIRCPIFFTGHSLGAALATLAAVRFAAQGVYAFGSPRVGNASLAARLRDVPVFRIAHGNDVVCTVPPEFLGFCHVGEEHRIGLRSGSALQFDPASLWNRLITPIDMLADHAPINYVEFI